MKLFLLGTAREGSTRVKDKMIRPFGNTSLYDIYLKKFEELQKTKNFDGIGMAINKNDKTLWSKSQNTIPILERNKESVRGITTRSRELHFIKDLDTDYIMWINGCLPFLTIETIQSAANYFRLHYPTIKSMTSVKKKWNWYWDANTFEAINNKNPQNVSTQTSPPLLETVHAFHVFSKKNMLKNSSYWNLDKNDPYLYIMDDDIQCYDIDNELDFKVGERLWVEKNQ